MCIGTWSIQGISIKTEDVFEELKKFRMGIFRLTEIKRKEKEERKNRYIYIYLGVNKEERAVYREPLKINIEEISWDQINDTPSGNGSKKLASSFRP